MKDYRDHVDSLVFVDLMIQGHFISFTQILYKFSIHFVALTFCLWAGHIA